VRETPNLTRLDQNFLFQFRNGVSTQARARSEMGLLFVNLQYRRQLALYRELLSQHRSEELKLEGLTYELLLQLKMWAIFELERQNNEIQADLDSLEQLLENSDQMESEELMKLFDQLMDEIMKDFEEMMANAAQQMDMTMQEFMNTEAMQDSTDAMQELREQIMEALKEGDMEKAKALMQELKAMMESSFQSMQESMGELSPEMQAMMQNMRELMGLLRELKREQEGLETSTRDLKQELDKEMGNETGMNDAEREQHRKATERIHELLTQLYNKLVTYKTQDLSENILRRISALRDRLEKDELDDEERQQVMRDLQSQEQLLEYVTRDGMDRLQDLTLRNLEQTEKLQEYLDQGELLLSLESALKLESSLIDGERVSERTASRQVQEETRPKETYREARQELYQIIDALQKVREQAENRRSQYMQQQKEQRQEDLAQRQASLEEMIRQFMEQTEDTFGGSQIEDKLRDIGQSMRQAERRLQGRRLEGGLQYEQESLQKIGEMMEQLQQSSQPSGQPSGLQFLNQGMTGNHGDPSLEDIFIPESQKKATRDQLRDVIRKQLDRNMPETYGKEIRKYYEKLMDQ
jgi:DNA repair exonuclease SbcCD ATPase subunit